MPTLPALVSQHAEALVDADEPDAFPPEGTDEATLDPDAKHLLKQDQRLKATRAVLKRHIPLA